MAYQKQTFTAGQTLTAAHMNHIEGGLETLDVNKQEKLVSGSSIKTVNGQSLLGSGNISTLNAITSKVYFNGVGAPQVYTCSMDATGLQVFADTEAIYDAFDALASAHPRMFKSNGSLGKDASGTYDIKYYTLGQTNPKITTDRTGNNANQWDDTKYPRPRIFINGNIHSWTERHCCYGLYLFVKELLESNEPWALFIKNNLVLDIIPQPNPWGYDNKTNVNKNNKNLNRFYLSDLQAENRIIVSLIESLIPRGLVGIIDLHNTGDSTPGYTIGRTTHKYWDELCVLASQIESITHNAYKELFGSDRTSFYHMWNYDNAGISGLLNDYADTKGIVCYTSEVATSLAERGSLMTKMTLANVINAFTNFAELKETSSNGNGDGNGSGSTTPDEGGSETPDGGDQVAGDDITSLFNWTDGIAIEAIGSKGGTTFSTSLFKSSDYVDVSEIRDFEMSFVKWRSSTGARPSLGYALYDADKNYITGYNFELADASVGNSAGTPYMITVNITDPNVKYIRTCYPADASKYGEFKAYKLVDESTSPDSGADRTDITDLFKWTNGAAIEATTVSNPGETFSTSLFKYCDYVDLSEIRKFEMSFVEWKSGAGKQATLGYALYDADKNYVSGLQFPFAESASNSSGVPYTVTVNITDPTVKYIRTCYPVDEAKYGVFKATKLG